MSSSIRDPAAILSRLLVAIASTGCGFVLGDIPDNPILDAGTMLDVSSPPDVSHDTSAADRCTSAPCPLPDVTGVDDVRNDIAPGDTDTRDTSSSDTVIRDSVATDVGASDTTTSDAPRDAPADRSSMDSSVKDAVSDPVSDPGTVDPCDKDGDHVRSDTCAGGTDCDDTTDQVYPDEPNFRDVPTHGDAGGGFDYDCNGRPDPEFPAAVNCSLLSLLDCDETTQSFLGMTTPACGQPGAFGHCVKGTLSCGQQVVEPNKIMRCK